MTHSPVWPIALAPSTAIKASEFAEIAQQVADSPDGAAGGTYNPTTSLSIAGMGIQSLNMYTATWSSAASNQAVHLNKNLRGRVTGGENATDTIEINVDVDANGAERRVFIDRMLQGVVATVKWGASTYGTYTAPADLNGVEFQITRADNTWHLDRVNHAPTAGVSASYQSLDVASGGSRAINSRVTFFDKQNMDLGGVNLLMGDTAEDGEVRLIVFEKLTITATVIGKNGSTPLYYITPPSSGGSYYWIELIRGPSDWQLLRQGQMPREIITHYTSSVSEVIDTDVFSKVAVTAYNQEDIVWRLKPPIRADQTIDFYFPAGGINPDYGVRVNLESGEAIWKRLTTGLGSIPFGGSPLNYHLSFHVLSNSNGTLEWRFSSENYILSTI